MFDLVLFDLDGTLVDSAPDIAGALNATLAEASLPTHALETARSFVGDGAAKLIERALPPSGPTELPTAGATASLVEALLPRFAAHYAAHLCEQTVVYPGVRETLHQLAARQVRMAIVTNKPIALAEGLLAALSLTPFFSRIVGDGSGYPRKPSPEGARALLQQLGVEPARTLLVGDGIPDAQLARALPCKGLAAAWGYGPVETLLAEGASAVLHHPAELLSYFAS